jgi:predicted alternative tryptophan synthase beta-subunit
MKAAVLIVELEDGKVVAPTAAATVASVIEAARKVRDAGELNKKVVRRGVVLHSQKGEIFRFRC